MTTKICEDYLTQTERQYVLKVSDSGFSLISVPPIKGTPHFSHLTVPASFSLKFSICSALHSRITSTTNKNFFVKFGFSNYHVSSNDDSAVKMKTMIGTVYILMECSM
jgi:hypothetical protein